MKPQYVTVVATPIVVPMDNNRGVFNVTIRCAAGQTVDATLEDVQNVDTAPNAPAAQVWFAVVVDAVTANVYKIGYPVRQIRITGAGQATVLQQGV